MNQPGTLRVESSEHEPPGRAFGLKTFVASWTLPSGFLNTIFNRGIDNAVPRIIGVAFMLGLVAVSFASVAIIWLPDRLSQNCSFQSGPDGTVLTGTISNSTIIGVNMMNGPSIIQNGTILHGTLRDGTILNGKILRSMIRDGIVYSAKLLNGTSPDNRRLQGTVFHGKILSGTILNGTVRNGTIICDSPTAAEVLRAGGAKPEAITALSMLALVLGVFSHFSYYESFRLGVRGNVWNRRGHGSRPLYLNGFISGLQVICSATLAGFLNKVSISSIKRIQQGGIIYTPAVFGLLQGGMSLAGLALMVAGPSPFRLPKSYEPTVKVAQNRRVSTAEPNVSVNLAEICTSQAAEPSTLATLYRAQRQKRQELIEQTQSKLEVRKIRPSFHKLGPAKLSL